MTNEQTTPSKKITIGLILGWIFGVLFALTGIISVFSEPIPGIVMLIMAAVLLPPVNKLVDKKWKFHLSGGIKIVVIIIGFVIFGATIDTLSTEKQQDNQPKIQQEQKQTILNTEQQKDETKSTEEQPKSDNNEQSAETEKTEITPASLETKNEIQEETKPVVTSFGNGTHIVDTDIQAGTYRSQGTKTCYWSRLAGFGGELDDIIANGNNSPEIITINASDSAFQTSGCGNWIAIEGSYPVTPATSFSDGTYEVGKHIEVGTYRADGSPDDLCYWSRLSNFSHSGISGVITNGNSPTVITVSGSDKGFSAFGCGNWTKIK